MKGIKRTGGLLCFLGCAAALAGILATAVPLIDYDPLQAIVQSFSAPENDGLLKILHSVFSFCLAENYLVFAGGIALLLIGGVIRTLADKALSEAEARSVEPEAATDPRPAAENNPLSSGEASLPAQETTLPANASPLAEDFRPQIIVKPLKASQAEDHNRRANPPEEKERPLANEDAEIAAPLPDLSVQAEEPSLPPADNQGEEESTPLLAQLSESPEQNDKAQEVQAVPDISDQPEERAERPVTDVSAWETKEATDERVIIARRENKNSEPKIPSEVTDFFEPTQLPRVPVPAEPTPLEQSALRYREHRTEEAAPTAPNRENSFQYKAFRAEGRPVVVMTLPNVQFQFEQPADPLPPFQAGEYEENDMRTPLQQIKSGVRIVNTLGRRTLR